MGGLWRHDCAPNSQVRCRRPHEQPAICQASPEVNLERVTGHLDSSRKSAVSEAGLLGVPKTFLPRLAHTDNNFMLASQAGRTRPWPARKQKAGARIR